MAVFSSHGWEFCGTRRYQAEASVSAEAALFPRVSLLLYPRINFLSSFIFIIYLFISLFHFYNFFLHVLVLHRK